jgi:hypothetical protein
LCEVARHGGCRAASLGGQMGIKTLIILLLALASTGCPRNYELDNHKATLAAGSIEQSAHTIQTELSAARPHADPTGQAHIDSASRATTSIQTQIPAIATSLSEAESIKADNDHLRADFWSFRQRGLYLRIKVALIGLVALWGICGAVQLFAAGTPYARIAYWVLHISTGFVFWIFGKIKGFLSGYANR